MLSISLPPGAWLFKRYGMMIEDHLVTICSWRAGKFIKLGEFVNDTQGLNDFDAFVKQNSKAFQNKPINICVSVVGEDYRFEKVAHLIGKYRSDMLKRKFEQMFRGATYQMASFEGRESVGRRQDMFLFCGVLSNEKVNPWVRDLVRAGFDIAGVHLASMMCTGLLKKVTNDTNGVNVISVVGKEGSIRHVFFVDGKLRFSRMSKSAGEGAEAIFRATRGEIEKTSAYLASIKLLQSNAKVAIHLVCDEGLVEQVNELSARGGADRFTVNAVSASLLGTSLGIKKPLESLGSDPSIFMHETLRKITFAQLAPVEDVRYYAFKTFSNIAIFAAVVWGLVNLSGIGLGALDSYTQYTTQNDQLRTTIVRLKENYENQVEGFGVPPSSPANMRSAVNVLDNVAGGVDTGPDKLMLYVSKLFENHDSMLLRSFGWYISNDPSGPTGNYAFANGRKTYELVQIDGELDAEADPEVAFEQYQRFVESLSLRPDMTVTENVSPALREAGGELVVAIDQTTDIRGELNTYTNRNFSLLIAWDKEFGSETETAGEAN